MQGDEYNTGHLTRRMWLFENSIPLWVLLWQSFYIHTHTILNSVWLFLSDSLLSRIQQLPPLVIPITTIPEVHWSLLIYEWINGGWCSLFLFEDHLDCYISGGMLKSLAVCLAFKSVISNMSFSLFENINSSLELKWRSERLKWLTLMTELHF